MPNGTSRKRLSLVALLLICFTVNVNAWSTDVNGQQKPLKIYISADMEGVVGVVTGEQLGPQGFEYQRFREFMTQEVNAAIEGALASPLIHTGLQPGVRRRN